MSGLVCLLRERVAACPSVGVWRPLVRDGQLASEGTLLGELSTLGERIPLHAPTTGRVQAIVPSGPVAYGATLCSLAHVDAESERSQSEATESSTEGHDLVMRSPLSGRFFARPAPDQAPFVSEGDELSSGSAVCLLEVMKTFNRVTYGGGGLPDRVRVVKVVPQDGDDLDENDVILVLEKLD